MTERTVRYSSTLDGRDCARIIELSSGRLRVEVLLRHGADVVNMAWVAPVPGRDLPEDRTVPALMRVSEEVWRVEAWDWSRRYRNLPRVLSMVITGCPSEWATA